MKHEKRMNEIKRSSLKNTWVKPSVSIHNLVPFPSSASKQAAVLYSVMWQISCDLSLGSLHSDLTRYAPLVMFKPCYYLKHTLWNDHKKKKKQKNYIPNIFFIKTRTNLIMKKSWKSILSVSIWMIKCPPSLDNKHSIKHLDLWNKSQKDGISHWRPYKDISIYPLMNPRSHEVCTVHFPVSYS